MSQEPKNKEEGFMYKFASFIVDKRNLIFLIVAIGLVFSGFSRSWVQVENQLSAYLPKESETYKGLHLMEDEFTTFGTAKLMLVNVSYDEAQAVSEQIADIDGVQSVSFSFCELFFTFFLKRFMIIHIRKCINFRSALNLLVCHFVLLNRHQPADNTDDFTFVICQTV